MESSFFKTDNGQLPEFTQGRYHIVVCCGVMRDSPKATKFVRENTAIGGKPNLTAGKFVSG